MTFDEYLQVEEDTGIRHEFVDGEAFAMAGGTLRHSRLKTKIVTALDNATAGSFCATYDADARVRILGTDFATYPDASVVCGDEETPLGDPSSLINPILVVEVLSDSTEAWDRGEKFSRYRMIPSLRYYLLVVVPRSQLELFTRTDSGTWVLETFGPGDTLTLDHPPITLDVDALYADLPQYIPPVSRQPAER